MTIIESTARFYKHLNEDVSDPRTFNYPLINNPIPVLLLVTGYIALVTYGPKVMNNRSAIQLDRTVIIYNILQIILNSYLFIAAMRACYIPLKYSLICQEIGTTGSPEEMNVVSIAYLYFMAKLFDLMDTVFIVLRKKSAQLSFLHIFHHTGMIFGGFLGVKYFPDGQGVFFGTVNSFVHAVMYSYYLLTVLDPRFRTFWMKKYITQLQIGQFLIIGTHLMVAALTPGCNYPKIPIVSSVIGIVIITYLFVKFYQAEYNKKSKKT